MGANPCVFSSFLVGKGGLAATRREVARARERERESKGETQRSKREKQTTTRFC